jgi:hypothetical protein
MELLGFGKKVDFANAILSNDIDRVYCFGHNLYPQLDIGTARDVLDMLHVYIMDQQKTLNSQIDQLKDVVRDIV